MVLRVYMHVASPPCRAVLMTAKHLGIKVETQLVDLRKGEHMKPEFLKINPAHAIPTIDDNGFIMGESRAIQTYLVNKYAPDSSLYPKDPQKRAVVDKMLYFDMGTMYHAIREYIYPQIMLKQPPDEAKKEAFKKAVALFEGFLGKSAYAAGDHLTLADLSILAGLQFMEVIMDFDFSPYPKVSAWMLKLDSELPYNREINIDKLVAFKDHYKNF